MSKLLVAAAVLAIAATAAHADSPALARFAKLCKPVDPAQPLLLDVHGGIPFVNTPSFDTMGRRTRDTNELFEVGGNVCPMEGLQIGGDYVFRFLPNSDLGAGGFLVHGTYVALHSGPLVVGVSGALFLDFISSQTDTGIGLGAWLAFEPVEHLQLFTGQPVPFPFLITPIRGITIPPVAYQLTLGNHNQSMTLHVPGGVMFEPIPELTLMAALDVADFFFTNPPAKRDGPGTTRAHLLFADFIPITVGGLYSIGNRVDVGAELSLDLRHASDFVIATIFVQVGVF